MNPAAFQRRHTEAWNRLAALTDRIAKVGVARLDDQEVAELQRLYRKASSDLAKARTYGLPPAPTRWLNELCARAHGHIYRRRRIRARRLGHFLGQQLPALLWRRRHVLLLCAATYAAAAVVGCVAARRDPSLARILSPGGTADLATSGLAFLALRTAVAGSLLGVGSVVSLMLGGAAAGASVALAPEPTALLRGVTAHAPAGVAAVVLAGAAGLHVGWTLVAPGARPRPEAVAHAAGDGVAMLLPAVVLLVIALGLEILLPDHAGASWLRLATGTTTLIGGIAYILLGRRRCANA